MLTASPSAEDFVVRPTPDGGVLTIRIPCRTTRSRRVAPLTHDVHIHPDWTVDVPHDLDAERIAVAFGGHLSCIGLVEEVVPALRHWIALMVRIGEVPFSLRDRQWTVTDRASCCRDVTFPGAADAAVHARSLPHVANRFGADGDLLAVVAAAAARAYGDAFDLDQADPVLWRAAAACRGGLPDVEYLFRCGLPAWRVVALHAQADAHVPLPRAYYTAVAGGVIDDGIGSMLADSHVAPDEPDMLTGYLRRRAQAERTP